MATGADGILTATWRPEVAAVSLEVDGAGWGSGVFTNLAMTPSFETTSGTVEVRRNRALSPMPSASLWTAQWGTGGAGTITYLVSGGPGGVGYRQMSWSTPGTGNPRMILTGIATAGIPVVAGETVPLSVDVACSGRVQITWDWYSGETWLAPGGGPTVTPSANIASPTRLTATAGPAPATATRLVLYVAVVPADVVVGTTLRATRLLVGDAGKYFDGSASPDSDLTPAWTGTANASASVLTGALVSGVATSACVAIRSTRWSKSGAYSMRLIPTGNPGGPAAYAYYSPAGGSRTGKTDTLLATVHLEAPLLDGSGARMYLEGGVAPGNSANIANVAGDQELRVTSARPGQYTASFFVLPSARGNGDVWVDCTALVEGVYTGPWFDGNNAPVSVPHSTTAWTSTPNASASTLTIADITEVRVMRYVAGETDVPVRGADKVSAIGGYWVGTDHEMPLHSSVTYQVIGYTAAGVAVLSNMVSVSTEGAPHGVWLKVAGQPNLSVCAAARSVDGPTSDTQGGVYDIVGGRGVAVASVAGINAERVTLTVGSRDAGQERSIRNVLETHRVLLIQDCGHDVIPSGWYFVSTVSRAPRDPLYRLPGRVHTLSLTRTGIPAGAGQGVVGWDFAALAATYPDFETINNEYSTFFDVARGPA